MVPFTPRLIPAILPNLAHHVPMIQSSANRTNKLLLSVIQALPSPSEAPSRQGTLPSERPTPVVARGPPASPSLVPASPPTSRQNTQMPASRESGSVESLTDQTVTPTPSNITIQKRSSVQPQPDSVPVPRLLTPLDGQSTARSPTPRPPSPQSVGSAAGPASSVPERDVFADAFDYQVTVNALTIQFLSEHEETRVAALKWLIMLHQKAPKKVRYSTSLRQILFIHDNRSLRWMMGRSPRCSRRCQIPLKRSSNTIYNFSPKFRLRRTIVISRLS
jgi:vacuole morphology and inheritance protein 14